MSQALKAPKTRLWIEMFLVENIGLEDMKTFKFNTDFIFIFKRWIINQHFIKRRKTVSWRCIFKCLYVLTITDLMLVPQDSPIMLKSRRPKAEDFRGQFPVDWHPTSSLVSPSCELSESLEVYLKLPCSQNCHALGALDSCSYFCNKATLANDEILVGYSHQFSRIWRTKECPPRVSSVHYK